MQSWSIMARRAAGAGLFAVLAATAALGDSAGIAMYGSPALPPDLVSLPYANPDAPKGGRIVFGENGSFDSLNPFIAMGNPATGISQFTIETLLTRSLDEPFTLYPGLAESVSTDDARSYVEFTLREGATFSDGSPVTVDDVLWSIQTLGEQGAPRYATAWKKIAAMQATGPRSLKITFNAPDREMPLLLGLRPILKKAQWQGRDFTQSTLEAPIGSGPYVVAAFEPGKFISYKKNPAWWGRDLPINRGLHNLDEIRYEYFANAGALFEAFKAGDLTFFSETNPVKWTQNYDFPAVTSGQVVKSEIVHHRPSGIEGFVFNTRRAQFGDWRVRQALITAFNFELVNRTLNGGLLPRITSYFGNSPLGMEPGTQATGRVAELLAPFAADLPPGTLEGYALPVSDGSEANRKGVRAATELLEQAGWTVQDGVLKNAQGTALTFDILLANGSDDAISAATIYVEALKRLGIAATITTVDSAQLKARTDAYDFDMTYYTRSLSLSPGNEQTLYWGKDGVTKPGTRNLMGMNSPAAEAMIADMLATNDPAEYTAAVQALDRVLTAGRYVIPLWYSDRARIAHAAALRYPEHVPLYGYWPGVTPDTWWYQE